MDARTKRLTLLACILGSTIVMVDSSVVAIALPQIRSELGGGLAGQQWVSNAYLLTLGSLLLVGGALADIYGTRRIFATGVAGFGATSLLCAAAPTIGVLLVGRALQGAFGALLTPAALAMIVAVFEQRERSRAIGAWTAWSGIGVAIGPLVGGWLIDTASWRWIFAINLPLVALTIALVVGVVPRAGERRRSRLDVPGAVLCAAGLTGVSFGLIHQPAAGWGATSVVVPLAAGAGTLAAFLAHERATTHPMLPLDLFARRNFALGNVETLAVYAALAVLFFYLVIYLQQVAGYSALKAGLATIPVTLVMLALAARFGALADRIGPRALMGGGPIVSALGVLALTRVDATVSYFGELLPAIGVFALGLAMTVAPLTATVLADAEQRNAGIASGVNNAVARVAALIGIAAVGLAIAAGFAGDLDERLAGRALTPAARAAASAAKASPLTRPDLGSLPARQRELIDVAVSEASIAGFRRGMSIAAVLLLVGGLLGAIGIRNPWRAVAARECPGGQLVGWPGPAAQGESADGP